jgi:4-hydroxy-2-oxoglutarate aldolase
LPDLFVEIQKRIIRMSPKPLVLAGIFPPLPTPFNADGEVDFDRLDFNLSRWNGEPLDGYVLGGSNGEYVLLTPDERVELVRAVRRAMPAGRLLIAGSAMESTRATIGLTRRMAEAGADAALVVTPSYYKSRMTPAALEHHFRQVADASPIPVVLYNVPANTGLDLPAQAVIRLAAHPNIVGLKESGGDVTKMGLMVSQTPDDFQILAGSAGFLLAALAVGAVGGVMALANIAAKPLAQLMEKFQKGDLAGARAIQLPLIEANAAVTARFGVPGLKAAMDLLGYYGGPVRSPLLPLSQEDTAALGRILVKAGLL